MKKIKSLGLMCLLVAFISSCTQISPKEAGFRISNSGNYRGVDTIPLLTGWEWYTPFINKIVTIPTTQQHIVWSENPNEGENKNEEIIVSCLGGAGFKMDIGFNYEIDPYKASKIYLKYSTEDLDAISKTYLRNAVRNVMQEVSGNITVDSLLNSLPAYMNEVSDKLTKKLAKEGFIVDLFSILSQPRPNDASLQASINAKITARQNSETVGMQLQSSIAEANKKIAEARGDSAANVIRAAGQAESNKRLQLSLTPLLIQKQYLETWDGKLPQYMLGGNTTTMIGLPK